MSDPHTRQPLDQQTARTRSTLLSAAAAIVAGLIAFLSDLMPYLELGEPIPAGGWITAVIAALVAIGAIFGLTYPALTRT